MTGRRRHLDTDDFAAVVRAAYGGRRRAVRAERLRGGSSKGVYRLTLDDATTGVAYVWNDDENYWPAPGGPARSGQPAPAELFEAAHRELSAIGVRVPAVLLVDRSATLLAADVAMVEDVAGGSLQDLRHRDPGRAGDVLRRLGDTVRAMHRHHGRHDPGEAADEPTEQATLHEALHDLDAAAARVPRIAAARQRLADTLHERYAAVRPRRRHGLIHGELGPDHVLIDRHDRPVLIDIEGARYTDVEKEHAFLELRFGADYHHLAVGDLDVHRLRLYRLALHLSLVAGPLRLLDGDFPDRAAMLAIVEHNITRTLAELA